MDEEPKVITKEEYDQIIKRMDEVSELYSRCEKICSEISSKIVTQGEATRLDLISLVVKKFEDVDFFYKHAPTLKRIEEKIDEKLLKFENDKYYSIIETINEVMEDDDHGIIDHKINKKLEEWSKEIREWMRNLK